MNASTRKRGRSHEWNGVEVEGANGGSFVLIEGNDTENSCFIKVGHSCVTTVSCTIPVSWLAAILTHAHDVGFVNAMGDLEKFPADYALMCDPEPDTGAT